MSQTPIHYYLLDLNYIRPIAEVEALADDHSKYLQAAFDRGDFLLAGRKDPWTGGYIFARADSLETVQRIIADDPFLKGKVTTYTITEFHPSRAAADLSSIVPKRV